MTRHNVADLVLMLQPIRMRYQRTAQLAAVRGQGARPIQFALLWTYVTHGPNQAILEVYA
jgi:hypothetical protein